MKSLFLFVFLLQQSVKNEGNNGEEADHIARNQFAVGAGPRQRFYEGCAVDKETYKLIWDTQ